MQEPPALSQTGPTGVGPPFLSLHGGGTNTLRILTAIIFGAECKHSATAECPAALQECKRRPSPGVHSILLQLFGNRFLPGCRTIPCTTGILLGCSL